MKKFILMLLAALLVLGLASVAMAAEECKHDGTATLVFPSEWAEEPTCLKDGYVWATCNLCNKPKTVKVQAHGSALGHDWTGDWEVDNAATCTEAGIAKLNCARCGILLETDDIRSTGHGDWQLIKTVGGTKCGEDIVETYQCGHVNNGIRCTETKTETVEVADHHLVKETALCKAVTCTEDGYDYFRCDNEGCTYTETKTIKHVGHKWEDVANGTIKGATCTETGLKTQKCKNCPATQEAVIAATNHSMTEWVVVHEATCEKEGLMTRYCKNDTCWNGFTHTSATEETKVIPARGHKWTEGEVIKAAKCGEEGTMLYVCDCKATKTEAIPALTHKVEKWTENAELNVKTGVCTLCKKVIVEALVVVPETPADPEAPVEPETPVEPEAPAEDDNDSEGTGSTTGNGSDASIPATGDNGNTMAYIMMVVAAAGLVVLAASKRKVNC